MKWLRTGTVAALLAVSLFATGVPVQTASAFPEKIVRIIVPFPAGGATDILARLVAERLSGAFGRPVVVENISGAAGATGTAAAAKAAADGHTLLMGTGTTTTLLPHLRSDLPYDPQRDFAAVTLIASFPNLLVVRPAIQATDVKSLIALVRAAPGKFSYASSGFGASPHLSAEWFKRLTKTEILHVPYTGSGPALPSLLGGHVDMMFDTLPSVLPLVQEGKLRALGVTTAERVPFLPGPAGDRRDAPGFRRHVVAWHHGAGRRSRRYPRPHRRAARHVRQGPGDREAPAGTRRRGGDDQHAAGVRRLDPPRLREVAARGPRDRHQDRQVIGAATQVVFTRPAHFYCRCRVNPPSDGGI